MNSQTVISVENVGKAYRINHQQKRQRYLALRDVIADKARRLIRPSRSRSETPPSQETFWALKDVSFQVKQGDMVGIIGRNGAGKSTLLKILSRITEPSEGRVRIRGRVASLLEVGTGFHPELTGRENIFLNGAILGMSRAEINRKFDEIVAFAEVERFLDTPVKHYSSGMYVRLAFAVAAHLEPEILIVDEVLAVGDGEFQKKCLGKMGEISRGGRTVMFVSHNLAAIKSLTESGIVMQSGRVVFDGQTDLALQRYMELGSESRTSSLTNNWGRGKHCAILFVRMLDARGNVTNHYVPGTPIRLQIELETDGSAGLSLEVFLSDMTGVRIGMASSYQFHGETIPTSGGRYTCELELASLWLASGSYSIEVATSLANIAWDHQVKFALEFEVTLSNPLGREFDLKQSQGYGSLALLSLLPLRFVPSRDNAQEYMQKKDTAPA